jgi:heme exporter protein A
VDGPPAIDLQGLVRRYGERTALNGVSVSVPTGASLVVFGPNGAGKSTLLRVLATLLSPHAGITTVLGHALPKDAWIVRGKIGLLGHEPLLYKDLSARENLRYHARLHDVPEARIDDLLDQVGMLPRSREPVRELSRGMVQRVAACRAVLHDPPLLLLDEPTANLDPAATDALEPLIGRESKRTRVVTSHDPNAGLHDADLVLGLRAGRVALHGPADTFDAAAIGALYA